MVGFNNNFYDNDCAASVAYIAPCRAPGGLFWSKGCRVYR